MQLSTYHFNRNADAPTRHDDGELLFMKPWEEQEPFDAFLDFVSQQELSKGNKAVDEVRYAQTRKATHSYSLKPANSHKFRE